MTKQAQQHHTNLNQGSSKSYEQRTKARKLTHVGYMGCPIEQTFLEREA